MSAERAYRRRRRSVSVSLGSRSRLVCTLSSLYSPHYNDKMDVARSSMGKSNSLVIAIGTTNPCKVNAVKVAFEEAMNSSRYSTTASDNSLSCCQNKEAAVTFFFAPYNVSSGVSHQPFGDSETKIGAINRASAAQKLCLMEYGSCDFAVGLEGGVEVTTNDLGNICDTGTKINPSSKRTCSDLDETLWCMAWIAILGSNRDNCLTFCNMDQCKYNSDSISEHRGLHQIFWGYGKTGTFALPNKIAELVRYQGLELGHADDLVFKRVNSKQGSGTVGILTNFMISRSDYYVHAIKLALIPWIWPNLYLPAPTSEHR